MDWNCPAKEKTTGVSSCLETPVVQFRFVLLHQLQFSNFVFEIPRGNYNLRMVMFPLPVVLLAPLIFT